MMTGAACLGVAQIVAVQGAPLTDTAAAPTMSMDEYTLLALHPAPVAVPSLVVTFIG